jgi:hypothetical protein
MVVLPSSLFRPPGPWGFWQELRPPPHIVAYSLPHSYSVLPKAAIIILINLVPPYSPAFPFPTTSLQGHQVLLDPTLYLPSASTVSLLKKRDTTAFS